MAKAQGEVSSLEGNCEHDQRAREGVKGLDGISTHYLAVREVHCKGIMHQFANRYDQS
jgi:hypothetical protein